MISYLLVDIPTLNLLKGEFVRASLRIDPSRKSLLSDSNERAHEAELQRFEAVYAHRSPDSSRQVAEHAYRKALDVAEHQNSRAWLLRSSLGLAQLLQERGRHAEVCELLQPQLAAFTEGRNLPDQQAAVQLLTDSQ